MRKRMSAEENTYHHIKQRCYNQKLGCYPIYGGRGIRVCERWLESFQNFITDMGPRPSVEHSIDRIDNNGPYSPENCRWATQREQRTNQSRTRLLTHNGATHSVAEWSRIVGIRLDTLLVRLDRQKWPIEKALVKIDARRVNITRPNCRFCGREMTVNNAVNLHFYCRKCRHYYRASRAA